jgi:predicted nucleic-acid-binding Zn-ribbon protein
MRESSTMRKGRCIQCRSNEVYINESSWGQSGSYQSNTVPITMFSSALLKNYVCTNCGYVESYVENDAKRKKRKEKWDKVSSVSRQ